LFASSSFSSTNPNLCHLLTRHSREQDSSDSSGDFCLLFRFFFFFGYPKVLSLVDLIGSTLLVTRPVLSLWLSHASLPLSVSLALAIALSLWLPLVSRPLIQSFFTRRLDIIGSNLLMTRPFSPALSPPLLFLPLTQSFVTSRPDIVGGNFLITSACSCCFASSSFSTTNSELCH
jgi:hypothetical protein